MEIVIIRSGETDWNREDRLCGQKDIDLNQNGREQACCLQSVLQEKSIEKIYVSPLKRAQETARIASSNLDIPIVPEQNFLDFHFGSLTGKTKQQIKEQSPILFQLFLTKPSEAHFPDGETLAVFRKRVSSALNQILATSTHRTIAVVSHGMVSQILLCIMLGLLNDQIWELRQDHCAYNIISYTDNSYQIVVVNDTCHLKHKGAYNTPQE